MNAPAPTAPLLRLRWLVAKNTAVQLLAQAAFVLIGVAMTMVLSRHLGVDGFGYFSYVFAFLHFFQVLNDLSITTVVVREIAREPARAEELIGGMLTFKLLLAAVSVLAAWASAWALGLPPPLFWAVAVFVLCLPLWALQLPLVIFQVQLRAVEPAVIGFVARLLGLGLVLAVVRAGGGLVALFTALLMAEAVSTALILVVTGPLVQIRWRIDPSLWRAVLRSSLPLGAAVLCGALVARVDFLLLERLADTRALGLYAAAHKITTLLEALPLAVMGTVYPVMARWGVTEPERVRRLYLRTTGYLTLAAALMVATVTVAAPTLVRLCCGSAFLGAEQALRILVWAAACLYAALAGGNLLISLGRERASLVLNATAAVVNVGLNLWLIPRFSFVGAALATAVAYAWLLAGTTVSALRALDETQRAAAAADAASSVPSESEHAAVRLVGSSW